jgi:hypothetical protein
VNLKTKELSKIFVFHEHLYQCFFNEIAVKSHVPLSFYFKTDEKMKNLKSVKKCFSKNKVILSNPSEKQLQRESDMSTRQKRI